MTQSFDPETFFRRPDAVAALVAAAEIFSLLKRSFDLPPAWAALLSRTAGDHAVEHRGQQGGKAQHADEH